MKRKSLLFLLLFALIAPWAAYGQNHTLTVYDGTATNNHVPMYVFYFDDFTRSQYVIPAAQIDAMTTGTISAIKYYTSYTTAYTTLSEVDIYLAEVPSTSISDFLDKSNATIVYSGTVDFVLVDGKCEATITFTTPYTYNGGNLLIGCDNTTDAGYKNISFYGQNVDGASVAGSNSSSLSNVTAAQQNFIPKTTFTFTGGNSNYCEAPSNLEITDVTHEGATVSWTSEVGNYNFEYKLASATDWTRVGQASNSYTLTNLTPLTAYDVRVQAVCDPGVSESVWVEGSFSTTAVAEAVGEAWADNFEGTSLSWELINGTCTNAWVWGTAANNGGTHGLYISNDNGTTNAYTGNSAAMVYATKLLNFTEGKFEFTYDWIANGESTYDYLRVALVPASVTLTAGTNVPTGFSTTTLPTDWIALDGGGKLNLVTAWQNKSEAINVTAGNYYLVMAWRDDTSTANQPPAAVDNVSITKVACEYDVTDLAVSNITTTGATLSWEGGEATQWQVAYGTASNFEGVTEEIIDNNVYELTSLQAATTYYVRVRAFCGGQDFGSWSDPLQFNTACDAIPALGYEEDFDDITVASAYNPATRTLPVCWNAINTTTYATYSVYPSVYYYTSTNYANSTPNCLRFYSSYSSYSNYDPQDQYAILPMMENLAGKQITLQVRGYNASSTFKIGTMSNPTDATTFTEIATQSGLTTAYQEFEYIVPATCTDGYLAIMIEAATSSRTTNGVYVDDITIDLPPTCPKPTSLAVTSNSQTAHGATITWTENGEASNWLITLSTESDFSNVTWLPVEGEPTYTFTGLDPETIYYVKVQAVCGEDDMSESSNVVSFTTTIACPAPTGLAASEISGYRAKLNWTGYSDSYIVSYRTAAYTDGFSEGFGSSLPSGWENKSGLLSDILEGGTLGTATQWSFGSSNSVFDAHARINIYGSSRYGWLITPEITVLQNASTLTFDLALTAYSGSGAASGTCEDDRFVVLVTTDNEATWTILREWNNEEGATYVYNDIPTAGENVSIDLSSYVGQNVRIAFYGESTVNGNGDNNLHIDNVHCGIDHAAGQWETVTVSDTTMVVLTTLIPETKYEAKVQGDCGEDGMSLESNVITFTTLNTCPVPTGLTAANVTATTADLSWNGSIDVDAYTVRYRVLEHNEGGINEEFGSSLPSGWENKSGLLSNIMDGGTWGTTSQWVFGSGNGVFESNHARINIYGASRYGWLITPVFTLASSTFTFDLALTDYGNANPIEDPTAQADDKFVVLVSTDNEETWTILREWNNTGSDYVFNEIATEGEAVSIDLSAYVGQNVRIAFYGESTSSTDSNAGDNDLHIDNVLIGTSTVVPTGEWQTASATATNVTLTGLSPITPYETQVKSDCSDPEEWSNVVTFTTTILTTVTQTIALTEGWNWVSFNAEITLEDLQEALVAAYPSAGMNALSIKSKGDGATNYNPNAHRWIGGLNTVGLDLSQMYMVKVPAAGEITVGGTHINPADHPITIAPGANWIAFPLSESMTVTEAFAGFPTNQDVIKAKTGGQAQWNSGANRWIGGLANTPLQPGQGYIYISKAAGDRTFTYPTSAK